MADAKASVTSHNYETGVLLLKRCGWLRKSWRKRYLILIDDVIVYFRVDKYDRPAQLAGRIFCSDVRAVEHCSLSRKRPFCAVISAFERDHVFSFDTFERREFWVASTHARREDHQKREGGDPVRKKSARLSKHFKRVTIEREGECGIGCTIKNVLGDILVGRVLPGGYVSRTGVLAPDDQFIDINGIKVSNLPIERIAQIVREGPHTIVFTVKPVTLYPKRGDSQTSKYRANTRYTEVVEEITLDQQLSCEHETKTFEHLHPNSAIQQMDGSNSHEELRNRMSSSTKYIELEFPTH